MDLLPCPFCGGEAEIERYGDHRQSTIYNCLWCGCSLETGEEWDHGKQWNTRHKPPESVPIETYPDKCHESHIIRSASSSKFDGVCVKCGLTFMAKDGWGKLKEPCLGKKS